jgi:ribosomal protein S18 acetylase RimI-like enzyme
MKECQNRDYSKILLLSDDNCASGIEFIKSIGGIYDSSEYRMKRVRCEVPTESNSITLRIAQKQDRKIIAMLNSNFFYGGDEVIDENEDDTATNDSVTNEEVSNDPNTTIFMVDLGEEVIGKIHVDYGVNSAFICGFGILSAYRRKGYGKAALNEVLRRMDEKNIAEVSLDVVCTNKNALNLYISCGFQQQSMMNYYQFLH